MANANACVRAVRIQLVEALLASIVVAVCAWPTTSLAQKELEYQERPYGFEGVKASPVSGFDLELLSARVDYEDSPSQTLDRFQLKFFLDRARPVNLVIRELDQKYYYWLDKVRPRIQGVAGFENSYSWPTGEVIRRLGGLKAYDLGVVVRLDKQEPSAIETVAPAVFYQTKFPTEIKGYVFCFGLRDDALVRAVIYEESKGKSVLVQDLGRQRGGRPFVVRWDLSAFPATPGLHRLVLNGYVMGTNDPVSQVVKFFHMPIEK